MRDYPACIAAQPVLALHDIDDAYAFVRALVQRLEASLGRDDREDLVAFLVVELWEASRLDPQPWRTSFSGWATPRLRLRIIDWRRRRFGRTRWQFSDRTYERPRRDVVSLDALSADQGGLDAVVADSAGNGKADRDSALAGLVAEGSGGQDWDHALLRAAAARRSRR